MALPDIFLWPLPLRVGALPMLGCQSLTIRTDILTWQARRYDQHGPKASVGAEREEELLREFPPLNEHNELQHLNGPCTIVDEVGNILAWVLPRMLSPERQVRSVRILSRLFTEYV